tara:strand:+ start:784 stop:2070 length:1287 start_codon:yes stop_codon:yes gene_type:complete
MKNIVFKIQQTLSIYLLIFALKIQAYDLCALVMWLNIKKIKNINVNYKNTNLKKVLVFPKSGGNEDLFQAFKNKKNNNIIFFCIPRRFLKGIHLHYFKDTLINDYFTKIKGREKIYKKKKYVKSLTKIFSSLNKFINFDSLISFNIFYYAEKYLDEVCKNLDKKFIILHKESTFTPLEEKGASKIYGENNDKSFATKISVYSKSQKEILIKSKIADKKQIVVNGCPRSDYSFKLRRVKPQNDLIVYYLIDKRRSQNLLSKKNRFNWDELYLQTLKYLLEYTKNNPNIKLILKGKTGVHNNLKNSKFLNENCIFIDGGTGEKLLKKARVVIAFNTTILFEAIAGNRNLIIPNFNNVNKKKKNLVYKIENSNYFVSSKSQFFKKINLYLNSKYKKRKLAKKEKNVLNYYLGNTDGKSGKRLANFLRKTIS